MTSSTWSGPDAAARARAAGDRVRRGHERVAAVVEVEQRALRALEQHVLAARRARPGPATSCRRGGRAAARPSPAASSTSASASNGWPPIEVSRTFLSGSSRSIRSRRTARSSRSSMRRPEAPGPVAVRRPDPAPGRAHLRAVEARLVGDVQGHVVRHDHVRAAADPHATDVDPARHEHVQLADERDRVDDHAVADDRGDVRVQDARRDQPELQDLVAADHGVTGVVAALVAHDHGDLLREEVGRLALPLVAPLQPDDDGRRHQARRQQKSPGPQVRDLDRRLPRRSADASADRRRPVARSPHGAADAPS